MGSFEPRSYKQHFYIQSFENEIVFIWNAFQQSSLPFIVFNVTSNFNCGVQLYQNFHLFYLCMEQPYSEILLWIKSRRIKKLDIFAFLLPDFGSPPIIFQRKCAYFQSLLSLYRQHRNLLVWLLFCNGVFYELSVMKRRILIRWDKVRLCNKITSSKFNPYFCQTYVRWMYFCILWVWNVKDLRYLSFYWSEKLFVFSTLKKPSKNYTCFISRRFGLFLIHLQFVFFWLKMD